MKALPKPTSKQEEPVLETSSDDVLQALPSMLKSYLHHNTEKLIHTKEVEALGSDIKAIMVENGQEDYSTEGVEATCKITNKTTFNTEILIDIIKKAGIKGIVKTQEYVDMKALEDALYNKEIDPIILRKSQITQEVVTLRVKQAKKGKTSYD